MPDFDVPTLAECRRDAGCIRCNDCDAGRPCTAPHAAPVYVGQVRDVEDALEGHPAPVTRVTRYDGPPVRSLSRRRQRRAPRTAPLAQLPLAERAIA
jgi:hypothetical protein